MCVIFNIQQVFRIEGVIPFGSMFPTTASLGKFYNRLSILITVFITGKFSKKALLLPRNCGMGGRWRSGLFGFLWPACDSVISCGRWVVTLSVCTFSPHTHGGPGKIRIRGGSWRCVVDLCCYPLFCWRTVKCSVWSRLQTKVQKNKLVDVMVFFFR